MRMAWFNRAFGDMSVERNQQMAQGDDVETVARLAEALSVAVRDEYLAEVAIHWRLIAPHRARVAAFSLEPYDEPAALFRP